MPPKFNKKFKKTKHHDKRESGAEAVKRRNAEGAEGEGAKDGDSSSSEEEEEAPKSRQMKNIPEEEDGKKRPVYAELKSKKVEAEDSDDDGYQRGGLNRAIGDDEHMLSQGPTRKQREELEKERKKKAYEKLHKEGKTDEAKADLERLMKIRKEREELKAKRAEEKAGADATTARTSAAKNNTAYIEALGGERKVPGASKSKEKKDRVKDECGDMYDSYKTDTKPAVIDPVTAIAGTMEACRLEEDDFM